MNNEFGVSWTESDVVYPKMAFQNLRRLAEGKIQQLMSRLRFEPVDSGALINISIFSAYYVS
jgi:hypothetical protein